MKTQNNKLSGLIPAFWIIFFPCLFSLSLYAASTYPNDVAITAQIKAKILTDPSFSDGKIDVSTTNHVVKLEGTVQSKTQRDALIQLVQSVGDVKNIDDSQLHVKASDDPMSDSLITAEIKKRFIQKKLFSDTDINALLISVETNDGIVSLSGKADSQDQVNNAILIAKEVPGVKYVKSNVHVVNH